jgi:hypothetical protein
VAVARRFIHTNPTLPALKEVYDFSGGINTLATNEALKDNVSPYLRNNRYRNRGTTGTRKGPGFLSVPIGELQDFSQTTAYTAQRPISTLIRQAAKIIPTTSDNLTRVDLNLVTGTGSGIIRVDVCSDSGGSPGTTIAESSIMSVPTSTYQYLSARFINPPALVSGTTYWIVAYVQKDGSGSFNWSSTTGTSSKVDTGNGTWATTTYALNIKTFLAPPHPTLGGTFFRKSSGSEYMLVANSSGVYTVNLTTGAPTQIFSGNSSATYYKFFKANDLCFFVNGLDAPQQFDGTTVSAVPGSPPIASDGCVHKNMAFWVATSGGQVRVVYSEPGDFTTYPSVNFFYVPTPFSDDPIQKMVALQDNLFIHTRETKWLLQGSDISSFILRRSVGLAGTVSPDTVQTRDNYAYFASDNGIYSFNGATDRVISNDPNLPSNIQPDFDAILDRSLLAAVVSGNYLRVFYPSPGNSYNNMAFVQDLIYGSWFIDDQAYFSKGFTMKTGATSEKLILCSSVVGCLYYADTQDSDLGAPIAFDYRTQYETYDEPAAKKQVKRFYPEFTGQQGNYTCSVYVDTDFSNSPNLIQDIPMIKAGPVWGQFLWGSMNWGAFGNIRPRLSIPGFFTSRQYRFYHKGVDNPVELVGISDYFFRKRPR